MISKWNMQNYRIGLLIPSCNTVMEPDFYNNVPEGWTLHTSRMYFVDATKETEIKMIEEFMIPAARDLSTTQPHVMVFGCTSASAVLGDNGDEIIINRLLNEFNIPVVTTYKSVQRAFQKASVSELVVITPYTNELNESIRRNLEDDGLVVARIAGLGISDGYKVAEVSGDDIVSFTKEIIGDMLPDALFVSCTNFPVMSVYDELQDLFPFPVITSNKAALEEAIIVASSQPK